MVFFAGGTRSPQPLIMADDVCGQGHAVELQGARTARLPGCHAHLPGRALDRPAAGTQPVTDATVMDALIAASGTPERLYGHCEMTHWLRRQGHPVAFCIKDRLMRDLSINGVRRGKKVRTTILAADGERAGDLLDHDSPRRHPTPDGSRTSPTAGPGPGSPTSR